MIVGHPFGPVIVKEKSQRARVTGTGLLLRKGIVSELLLIDLNEKLNKSLKPGAAPKALLSISLKLCELSGMGEVLKTRPQIAGVEYFFREVGVGGIDGPLFEIVPKNQIFEPKNRCFK